jgi:prophage antirepressor-like protein
MKDSDLITFTNDKVGELRGFMKDGEPWFLAGQVCRCLGIKDASTAVKQTVDRLKIAGVEGAVSNRTLFETTGGRQSLLVINEQCLYELIFQSRKQKAIKFRSWVTGTVLPELRKNGEYRMQGKLIRKNLTDEIKESGENERMHGHAYSAYTRLVYKSLGITTETSRDAMSAETLEKLAMRENLVQALLAEGRTYHEVKAVLEGMTVGASGAG